MGFAMHLPLMPLRPFVAKAYGYDVPRNPTGVHRGLPSPHVTLVLDLIEPLEVCLGGRRVRAHGVVGGLHTEPAMIDASRPQRGVQYALTPLGVQALFGMPAAALHGQVLDLSVVLGCGADHLVEELRSAETWRERFVLVDAALLRGAWMTGSRSVPVPAEVLEAWRLVFSDGERLRVGDIAARVGWSRRHLTERFRLATGLTLMEAIRVGRFEAARALLLDPRMPSLASVANQAGYADQAHMAHEWRALAGCSVGTWRREELPFLQDSPTPGTGESAV